MEANGFAYWARSTLLCTALLSCPFSLPALEPASFPAVQIQPNWIASGDLNGDGVVDLAVANSGAVSVSVLLGQNDGGFAAATHFPLEILRGGVPNSVAIGNFNGDAFPDLVIGLGGVGQASRLQVMLGIGEGAFAAPTTHPAGGDPWVVVTGDFTGDGRIDIAAANRFGGASVLAGNGDGTFAAPQRFDTGDYSASIATADFNGDGRLDLVTANSNSDNLSLLLANDAGSFNPAVNIPLGNYPFGLAVGDIDGNGTVDVAVTDSIDDNVHLLLNNGFGVLTPITPVPVIADGGPVAVAIGRLNADGFVDLAVANFFGNGVSVLFGNGLGGFVPDTIIPGNAPSYAVIDRFGTDSAPDLAFANYNRADLSVLLNTSPLGPQVFANGFEAPVAGALSH